MISIETPLTTRALAELTISTVEEAESDRPVIKTCSKCKQNKPIGEFYKNQSAKDGLQYHCRQCSYELNREYYANLKKTCTTLRGHRLTIDDQTKSISEWALLTNQPCTSIYGRFTRGWTPEEAVFGKGASIPTLTVGRKTLTVGEWAAETGEDYDRIYGRHLRGWNDTSAVFGKRKNRIAVIDDKRTVGYWASLTGQRESKILRRLRLGWSDTQSVWGRS